MNITQEVINDLLPIYLSNECSADTKLLVDEYLKVHPAFAEEVKNISNTPFLSTTPNTLNKGNEMVVLKRTKRLIRLRTYFKVFAILCTLSPFSFSYSDGKITWLFLHSLGIGAIYLIFAVIFWVGYFLVKKKTNEL